MKLFDAIPWMRKSKMVFTEVTGEKLAWGADRQMLMWHTGGEWEPAVLTEKVLDANWFLDPKANDVLKFCKEGIAAAKNHLAGFNPQEPARAAYNALDQLLSML